MNVSNRVMTIPPSPQVFACRLRLLLRDVEVLPHGGRVPHRHPVFAAHRAHLDHRPLPRLLLRGSSWAHVLLEVREE